MAIRVPLTDAQVSALAPVQTVAGRAGTVVLAAADIASGTVDIARLPTCSQAEAEAGTSTAKTLTPERVKQAVTAYGLKGIPNVILEDQRSSGTGGGTSVATSWNTRTLNTEVYDPSELCTLTANKFTFTVDGFIEFEFPVYISYRTKIRLYSVTAGAMHTLGASSYNNVYAPTLLLGVAFVTAGVEYRIDTYHEYGIANGFGYPASQGTEIYGRIKFYRSAPA